MPLYIYWLDELFAASFTQAAAETQSLAVTSATSLPSASTHITPGRMWKVHSV